MPTGYTDIIDSNENVTFDDYFKRCLRVMGAFMHMRDSRLNEELKTPEISDYHSNKIKEIKKDLEKISNMSKEKANTKAEKEYNESKESYLIEIEKIEKIAARYNKMKLEVKKWKPPTKEHENFKKFMLEQLETGMPYMSIYYTNALYSLKKISGEEWLAAKKEDLTKDLEYHTKEYEKEKEMYEENIAWIKDALNSL